MNKRTLITTAAAVFAATSFASTSFAAGVKCTGSNAAGTAALAIMACAAGPSDITTVPPDKMSVATICTGSFASSRLR